MNGKLLDNIVAGLKKMMGDTHFEKVVIGLSGGIDSAVSAAIAVRALGWENVFPYFMPYKHTSPQSHADARLTAEHLQIPLQIIDITFFTDLYIHSQKNITPLRTGNILSRARMLVLFDQSALHHALVLGTGNKSEAMLGYMTWFGDSASSINPLGELYKTEVWELAREIGLPEQLISKAPSADHYIGQTDEEDLGFGYLEVDKLLNILDQEGLSVENAIKKGFSEDFVKKVVHKIKRNEFKRKLPAVISRKG